MTVQITDIDGDGIPDQLFFNGEFTPGAGYPYFFLGAPAFGIDELLTLEIVEEFIGEDGVAALIGGGDDAEIEGTEANELIAGTQGDDMLLGSGGNDMILGGAGNDLLIGDDFGSDATSPAVDDISPL